MNKLGVTIIAGSIGVLALSACCYAPQPQQALDAGCDVFMAKPVDADCLLEEIRAAFRRSIREGTIVT